MRVGFLSVSGAVHLARSRIPKLNKEAFHVPRVKFTVVFVLALASSLALARDKKDKGDKHPAAPQAVAT